MLPTAPARPPPPRVAAGDGTLAGPADEHRVSLPSSSLFLITPSLQDARSSTAAATSRSCSNPARSGHGQPIPVAPTLYVQRPSLPPSKFASSAAASHLLPLPSGRSATTVFSSTRGGLRGGGNLIRPHPGLLASSSSCCRWPSEAPAGLLPEHQAQTSRTCEEQDFCSRT